MSDTQSDVETADDQEPEQQPEPEVQVVYIKEERATWLMPVAIIGSVAIVATLIIAWLAATEPPSVVVVFLLGGIFAWIAGLAGPSRVVSYIALAALLLALVVELFSLTTSSPNAKPATKKRGDYGSSAPASTATYPTQAPLTAASQPTYATQEPVATDEPTQAAEPTTTVRTTTAKPKPTNVVKVPVAPPAVQATQAPNDAFPAEQPQDPPAAPPTHTGNGSRITGTASKPG